MVDVQTILKLFSSHQFSLNTEEDLKIQMKKVLDDNKIEFVKEYVLDKKNRPDFFIEGIAVEVKIKGAAKAIYRQCERYCGFEEVKSLILVTNRSMGFPETINEKPCYVVSLGKGWL